MDRRSFYRPSFIPPVLGSLTTEQVKKEVSRRVTSPSESWPLWSSSSPSTFHVGVMHIDARIEICLRFIATGRTAEQLATPLDGAGLPGTRKPFSSGSTPTAVLAGSMRIDFTRHHPLRIRFVLRVVSDFPLELVGLLAIEPPGLTHGSRLHLAQALKQQHTTGILLTDRDKLGCHLMGDGVIHPLDMTPDLLIASFPFDCFP